MTMSTQSIETIRPTPAATRSVRRTGIWAGLLWLVAGVGAFTPEMPAAGAGAGEVRAYIEQNLGTLTINAVSAIVAVVALLALVATLGALLDAHAPGSTARRYVFGAGLMAAVQLLFFSAVYSVWIVVDPAALGDGDLTGLHTAGMIADAFGSLTLFVTCSMVAVVSWLALRHRFLSRSVAVLGLLIAAEQLLSLGRLFSEGVVFTTAMYVGVFGWFLWPAVVAVDLAVQSLRNRQSDAAPA